MTLTIDKYFLSNGLEEQFYVAVNDVLFIGQCEDELLSAGLAGVTSVRGSLNYSTVTGARTDIPWSPSPTSYVLLGTAAAGLQLIVNGVFSLRGNTCIVQGQAAPQTSQGNGCFAIGPGGGFAGARAITQAIGTKICFHHCLSNGGRRGRYAINNALGARYGLK